MIDRLKISIRLLMNELDHDLVSLAFLAGLIQDEFELSYADSFDLAIRTFGEALAEGLICVGPLGHGMLGVEARKFTDENIDVQMKFYISEYSNHVEAGREIWACRRKHDKA